MALVRIQAEKNSRRVLHSGPGRLDSNAVDPLKTASRATHFVFFSRLPRFGQFPVPPVSYPGPSHDVRLEKEPPVSNGGQPPPTPFHSPPNDYPPRVVDNSFHRIGKS